MSLLGRGLVLAGLLVCTVGVPLGFWAGYKRNKAGLDTVRVLALLFAGLMLLANLAMEYAILTHDFSVSYVAQVGSRATPTVIAIVSLWSSLEGSILFWGLILGLYTAGVAVLQRRGHEDYMAYTLAIMLAIGVFFCFLIAGPADPFAPMSPVPADGPGPNPLLQNHPLMIIHPPMLYLGYVGMSVPFAMACAALLRGTLGPTWLRPLRNWLLVPWGFLTMGIMLGGWWAYEVLGWGGYWAWDPVENASFLPWLTGTAAVHSAMVQQRRGTLKGWTVVLVLISFLLTILGTFMTRSGIFNSVHAFGQGPVGPLLLGFLAVASIFSVVLLAFRVDTLAPERSAESLTNREGAVLLNNLVLLVITFTVLVGTVFPLINEALTGAKVSVGPPYFNKVSLPMFVSLLMLMGIGPALPWGTPRRKDLTALLRPLPLAIVAVIGALVLGARSPYLLLTVFTVGYGLWITFDQASRPARIRVKKGEKPTQAVAESTRRAPRILGAYLVHLGVLLTGIAIAVSSVYQTQEEKRMVGGDEMQIGSYLLSFRQSRIENQPHRRSHIATIDVFKGSDRIATLEPAMNHYPRQAVTSPAVRSTLTHDLYLTALEVNQAEGYINLRAIITPMVYWVWLGVFVMCAGTVLCLIPPRRRERSEAPTDDAVAEAA